MGDKTLVDWLLGLQGGLHARPPTSADGAKFYEGIPAYQPEGTYDLPQTSEDVARLYQGMPSMAPDTQLYLNSQYGNAQPNPLPVTGLNVPTGPRPMDPTGQGASLADFFHMFGYLPARRDPRPGEPYMGPLAPIPATMSAGLRERSASIPADRPKDSTAETPMKRKAAKSKPAPKTAKSKSGKSFVVGKLYTNAQGQRLRFQADGTFKKV